MTACVDAVSIGCAVPRPHFVTTVHSVFRNAVNLRGPGESLLLTLLLSGENDLPQGIRLGALQAQVLEGLQIGTPAVCTNDLLALGDKFLVDLRPGRRWECDLYSLDADMHDPAVIQAWQTAWEGLRAREQDLLPANVPDAHRGQTCMFPSLCSQRLETAVSRMLDATALHDLNGMAAMSDLIGVGLGLTPSGDDLLTGYLAGLWCSARQEAARRDFLWAVAEFVIRDAARTNDVARTYLCLAARGQVSSLILDLASSISRGDCAGRVRARAEAAMRVGHTSGMAAVNGLLLGLAAWDGPGLLGRVPGDLVA